jgi:Tfp pilus assembly protein FimV
VELNRYPLMVYLDGNREAEFRIVNGRAEEEAATIAGFFNLFEPRDLAKQQAEAAEREREERERQRAQQDELERLRRKVAADEAELEKLRAEKVARDASGVEKAAPEPDASGKGAGSKPKAS